MIFPNRADASKRRLGGRGRERPSVGTSATGHGLHLSTRETGLTGTWSRESLEDGAEGGEGGMHRERSMHASLDQAKYFLGGRVEPWVGFKIYNSLLAIAKVRYIRCCCGRNRVQFCFSVRHTPGTPSYWLGGSILGLLLLSYTHIIHTYISDQGSGGSTIHLALLSTGINEESIKRFLVPLKHSTEALNTTSNSWKILPRTRHIPKLLPPTNKLLYNIQVSATDIRWSTLPITTKGKHM